MDDDRNFTCALFLDVQKAFDIVNINILFEKSLNYGICDLSTAWLKSYFQGSDQYVTTLNEYSINMRTP